MKEEDEEKLDGDEFLFYAITLLYGYKIFAA